MSGVSDIGGALGDVGGHVTSMMAKGKTFGGKQRFTGTGDDAKTLGFWTGK
jgi:hypothetical protein